MKLLNELIHNPHDQNTVAWMKLSWMSLDYLENYDYIGPSPRTFFAEAFFFTTAKRLQHGPQHAHTSNHVRTSWTHSKQTP